MSANMTRSKKKRIKAVSQKVKVFRANEPLISVFMWGINHTVQGLTHVNVPVMLMPDDFKASSKVRVDNHFFNKENLPSHYKIKEYCPVVFRKLREIFGIKEAVYLESLTKFQPRLMDSSGKSGAKFYLSYDKRFVLKSLYSEEVMQMHQILKSYHQHVVERNGRTLLTQYLGMYRITVEGSETYIVVMRNIFGHKITIHKKYDLKGSTVQRSASMKERSKDVPTYKDNDFVNDGIKIHIGEQSREKLLETLSSDCIFMAQNKLMDYSLICGIHDLEREDSLPPIPHSPINNPDPEDPYHSRVRSDGLGRSAGDVINDDNPPENYEGCRPPIGIALLDEDNGSGADDYETDEYNALPTHNEILVGVSTDEGGSGADADGYNATSVSRGGGGGSVPVAIDSESEQPRHDAIWTANRVRTLIDPGVDVYAIPSSPDSPKKRIYFIAIIDILTHYGMKKKTAHAAKTVKHGAEAISTVHPDQYAKRFMEFIEKCLD